MFWKWIQFREQRHNSQDDVSIIFFLGNIEIEASITLMEACHGSYKLGDSRS